MKEMIELFKITFPFVLTFTVIICVSFPFHLLEWVGIRIFPYKHEQIEIENSLKDT